MKVFTTMATIAAVMAITGCASAPKNVAQANGVGLSSAGTAARQIPAIGMSSAASVTRLPSAVSAAGMMGRAASSAPVAAQTPSLVNILVQQLGITPQQATGGAGSIFSVAKQSMSSASFGQVSKAVPGMNQLLTAAPALGGSTGASSLMGSVASALGGGSNLGNMATLASSFQSLGMGSGMMGQFIPVILQYIQARGGSTTMGLLQGALMP